MKQRASPSFIARFFILLVVICLVVLGGIFWWKDGVSAVNPTDTTVHQFIIPKGEPISSIAARLSAERLIRSKTVFFLYIKLHKLDSKIQAGNFQLHRDMALPELTHELTVGTTDVWVTTLEGWRNEEIADKLSQDLGLSPQDFLANAQEGYMFPDTYLLPKQASASAIVAIFRANFDTHLTPDLRQAIASQGRTLDQVVILASILEREGRTDTDRPVIAGILLKREKAGWPLNVDATLQYALGYQAAEHTWWKKTLTSDDQAIDSPYNSYKNLGFPPTPIANPGMSSFKAAIYPQDSPYWFYLHDNQGQVHYAKTLEEHNENIKKYLQ